MLNATQNQIDKLDICDDRNKLIYLQILTVAQNQIKEVPEVLLPSLYSLNLSANLIASAAKFTGHATLRILDLRKNKLANFLGFKDMPALEELYAAENELMTLEGLENLPRLKRLHIRKNPVRSYLLIPE
jgi:Leucine-rich repeat (LRR) protein